MSVSLVSCCDFNNFSSCCSFFTGRIPSGGGGAWDFNPSYLRYIITCLKTQPPLPSVYTQCRSSPWKIDIISIVEDVYEVSVVH